MAGSAADAISQAVERSKQLLFPVKLDKWFALGFTVFLAQCGEGQGGMNVPTNFGSPSPSSLPGGGVSSGFGKSIDDALKTFNADVLFYVSLAIGAIALSFGVWVLVLWLSSRAKLMFVESVIWDRVDVGGQWARAAELGSSLFKFRTALAAAGMLLGLLALGGSFAIALPDLRSGQFFGSHAVIAYAVLGLTFFFLGLPLAIVALLVDDFVVPLMVIRNARVAEAWQLCRTELLAGNVGGVVLFYVLRVALAMGVAMVTMIATCLTCCLTLLPYLGTVILLPIFVFYRAYPLYYLEQRGIAVFPQPEPAWARYDAWRFPR
jgi:hypothetical protein